MARVLIVDDDLAALAAARQVARAAGHDVLAATSAADAGALLESASPPEVLLVAATADRGEALALAARVSAAARGGLPLVLVVGGAGIATALPVVARPLTAPTLHARITEGLAARRRRPDAAPPRPPPPPPPPSGAASPPDAPPQRRAAHAAEAALRALFRRPAAQASSRPDEPPPAPPASLEQPAPPRAEAPSGRAPAAPPAVDLAALEARTRTRDYFEVLGLGRDAVPTAVRDAASRLLADIDAARLTAEGVRLATLDDVRQVVVDARDVLLDTSLRQRYLDGIGR